MTGLRPLLRLLALSWLRFKRDTCNPLAPHFPGIVLRIATLESQS